jgi:hypothetical protein
LSIDSSPEIENRGGVKKKVDVEKREKGGERTGGVVVCCQWLVAVKPFLVRASGVCAVVTDCCT